MNCLNDLVIINTFKYNFSCTDGKISTVVPFNSCVFLSCRPFVVITNFSGQVLLTVNCPSQETEETHHSTRRVENAVIRTKWPTGKKKLLLNGMTVEK